MNNKGFAASGILYTILLIFLGIMMMSLFNFESKKNILDTMKNDIKGEVFDYESAHTYMDGSGAPYPELYTGMIPVKYDSKGNTVVANLKDKWYDYSDHEWANAVLVKNKVINSYDKYSDSNKVHGATLSEGYVSFDGVDDYIELGLENYDFGKTISYAVKFKFNTLNFTTGAGYGEIINNFESAGFNMRVDSSGALSVYFLVPGNSSYTQIFKKPSFIEANKEYTLAVTYDGNTAILYSNGVEIQRKNFSSNIKPSAVPIALGANPNANGAMEYSNINIYQVAVFDRALTSDEIEKGFKNDINVVNDEDLLIYDDFSNHKYKSYEKIQDDEILQYYVWIPRYRYKLFNSVAGESAPEQMIEIEFEHKNITKSVESTNGLWLTHPAFTFGNTELNGFWVGKFETSHSDSDTYINLSTANKLNCSNENCEAASGLVIKPNVISLVNNNIANEFYASRSIENSTVFGLNPNKVDTHMMKNMEWGAVAYLSVSEFGLYSDSDTCNNPDNNINVTIDGKSVNRCEIKNNIVNIGYGKDSEHDVSKQWGPTVTGCGSNGSSVYNTHNETNPTCIDNYSWNMKGISSSTTGNIYGIYDLAGGSSEHVMGNQSSSTTEYIWYPKDSGFVNEPDSKYYDKYLASIYTATENDEIQDQARGQLGDATREILKTYGSLNGGWNRDLAHFVSVNTPWFIRGGISGDGLVAGMFYFIRNNGKPLSYASFRVVLSAEDISS